MTRAINQMPTKASETCGKKSPRLKALVSRKKYHLQTLGPNGRVTMVTIPTW